MTPPRPSWPGRHPSSARLLREIARISLADLRHDWILAACVVSALAAVFSPLLILSGLKHGYIATMREQLLHDPRCLEIWPREVPHSLPATWFTRMRARAEVAFLLPATPITYSVTLRKADAGDGEAATVVDVIPSAPHDPLLLLGRVTPPSEEECVLTEKAAQELNAAEGQMIRLTVQRRGAAEGTRTLKVRGILGRAIVARSAIFLPLQLLDRISSFKFGLAVPEYGWAGGTLEVSPAYSQVLVLTKVKLTEEVSFGLQTRTGFSNRVRLAKDEAESEYALSLAGGPEIIRIEATGQPGYEENITRVKAELNGRQAVVVRANPRIPATLSGTKGAAPLSLTGMSVDGDATGILRAEALPEWAQNSPDAESGSSRAWRQIAVAPEILEKIGEGPWEMRVQTPERDLIFPIEVQAAPALPPDHAWIPSRLSGVLQAGQKSTGVAYDAGQETFVIQRDGYRSFRLFARNLDDVERLVSALATDGIRADSSTEQIGAIRALDKRLDALLKLAGAVTGTGAAGALLTSLLASIERKKREFGVLRLMGTGRVPLILIPVLQAQSIVGAAFGVAVLIQRVFSFAAGPLLSSEFHRDSGLGLLRGGELAWAWGAAAGITLLVSLLAAARLFRIEPADAIRFE